MKTKVSLILGTLLCSYQVYAEESVSLERSVVSASGFLQEISDAPASISVITKEDLEKKSYRDIAEAISDTVGVDVGVEQGKTGGLKISIRGMPAQYTLLLVDGRRQGVGGDIATRNKGFEQAYAGFIPPLSAIERIEVIKGPMSTLYGSDAIGGVVNIITKKVSNEWSTSVLTEGLFQENSMWGNSYSASVYTSGPLIKDKLGLTLRAREFYRQPSNVNFQYKALDGTMKEGQPGYIGSPTQSNSYHVGGRLSYIIDSYNSIYLDIDYANSYFDNKKGQIADLIQVNPQTGALRGSGTETITMDKAVYILSHEAKYNHFSLTTSVQYNTISNDGRVVVGPVGTPYLGKNREIQGSDFIVDSILVAPIGQSHIISTGLEYRLQSMQDYVADPTEFSQYNLALFAQDEWSIVDSLIFTFGTRYDYHEEFGSQFSPRAYLVYHLTDNISLKGGVSTGFKAPYANELIRGAYGYGAQGTLPFYGNPELKAESSVNYEIGITADYNAAYGTFTFFKSDFDQKISSNSYSRGQMLPSGIVCDYARGCDFRVNVDDAVLSGIELSGGIKPIYGVSLDVGYTYIDSEQQTGAQKGQPLAETAKHSLNAKLSYEYAKFNSHIKVEHKSKRFISDSSVRKVFGDFYKPYTVASLGLGYKISDTWRVNGGIYNLLNKKFADYEEYITGSYANRYKILQEGRRYWLSIGAEF